MSVSSKGDRRQVAGQNVQERRAGSARRAHARVGTQWPVDYKSQDTYLFSYISDISDMGIFVCTPNPEAPGTAIQLRFGSSQAPVLELQGEVAWVNAQAENADDGRQPGMGVRFVNMTQDEKQQVQEMVRTLALLDHTSMNASNSV